MVAVADSVVVDPLAVDVNPVAVDVDLAAIDGDLVVVVLVAVDPTAVTVL